MNASRSSQILTLAHPRFPVFGNTPDAKARENSAHLVEDTHLRLLRLLDSQPGLSQRALASELGISLGKTNYCLQALVDKGWIKIQNFQRSERKMAYAYLLTPSGLASKAALTARFLQRKMQEFEALKAEIQSLQNDS